MCQRSRRTKTPLRARNFQSVMHNSEINSTDESDASDTRRVSQPKFAFPFLSYFLRKSKGRVIGDPRFAVILIFLKEPRCIPGRIRMPVTFVRREIFGEISPVTSRIPGNCVEIASHATRTGNFVEPRISRSCQRRNAEEKLDVARYHLWNRKFPCVCHWRRNSVLYKQQHIKTIPRVPLRLSLQPVGLPGSKIPDCSLARLPPTDKFAVFPGIATK